MFSIVGKVRNAPVARIIITFIIFHITLGSPYVLVWPNVSELRVLRVLTYSLYRPVIVNNLTTSVLDLLI